MTSTTVGKTIGVCGASAQRVAFQQIVAACTFDCATAYTEL